MSCRVANGEKMDLAAPAMTNEQIKRIIAELWQKYIPLPDVNMEKGGKDEEKTNLL